MCPPILAGGTESLDRHGEVGRREITVLVDVPVRLPVALESTIYFVVAEALTNVTRHSGAERAEVRVHSDGSQVFAEVADHGRGGADEQRGTGLAGLRRRVAAFDGRLLLNSPVGGPTVLRVELPCVS